jgi:uncharacterized tellurite resistance protein B-like protein
MLEALRSLFDSTPADSRSTAGSGRSPLQLAVAVLLHEARRADYDVGAAETAAAERALADLFGLAPADCAALLEEGRARAQQLTSFFPPVSVIKREFSIEDRIRVVEQLWRVSFADGKLDYYEDHYVRKIARLLHVPNTQSMLARNRARS